MKEVTLEDLDNALPHLREVEWMKRYELTPEDCAGDPDLTAIMMWQRQLRVMMSKCASDASYEESSADHQELVGRVHEAEAHRSMAELNRRRVDEIKALLESVWL